MKRINKYYLVYLHQAQNLDNVIIDPPWYYNQKHPRSGRAQLKYNLWEDNIACIEKLFLACCVAGVRNILLWVTNPVISEVFEGVRLANLYLVDNNMPTWLYRTMVTWEKLTTKGNLMYGTGHYFRSCTEHVLVFNLKGTQALRTNIRNLIVAENKPLTEKPHSWERQVIEKIGGKWAYLFSGPNVTPFRGLDVDCVDICHGNSKS